MNTVPTSRALGRKMSFVWPWLNGASARILEAPDQRTFYPEYLRAMFGISRAAVPLMERAIVRLSERCADEPTTAPLIEYYTMHIADEQNHDQWILEDLETIGIPAEWTTDHVPQAGVAALVGAAYYWIEHHHPVSLLGYLKVMESSQPSMAATADIQRSTGFPESALRCMSHHAQADPEHIAEVDDVIDAVCDANPTFVRLVTASCLQTCSLLLAALGELVPHDLNAPGTSQ